MVFLLVLFLIPWYLWSINCTGQDRWRKITLDASLRNIPYFDWDPSNKWDFYCWFTSASQWDVNWDPSSCKPGSLPKIPLFTGIPVGYGGIWWDSGEIWTGIPVGCVLGSRWDMVGSRLDVYWDPGWMCTGIPVGYGGIWTGIPVNVDWDPLPNIPVG